MNQDSALNRAFLEVFASTLSSLKESGFPKMAETLQYLMKFISVIATVMRDNEGITPETEEEETP